MKDRQPWIDALRGVAVVAVVLFHTTLFVSAAGGRVDEVTATISSSLGVLRMPILFTLSGLLASTRVSAGIRDRKTIARAVDSYYLYACWLAVYFCVGLWLSPQTMWRITSAPDLLVQALVPDTPLWYLFALSAFTLALAATRRVPAVVVIAVLAVIAIATGYLPPAIRWWALGSQMLSYGVFFAIGARAPGLVRSIAQRRQLVTGALACAALAALVYLGSRSPSFLVTVPLALLQGMATVVIAIGVSTIATRWRPVEAALSRLGRNTLPIYVLHVPLLWMLFAGDPLRMPSVLEHSGAASYVIAGTVCLAALALHALILRIPGARLLFVPPSARSTGVRSFPRSRSPRELASGRGAGEAPERYEADNAPLDGNQERRLARLHARPEVE